MVLIDQQLYSFSLPVRFFILKVFPMCCFKVLKVYVPRIQQKSRAGKSRANFQR